MRAHRIPFALAIVLLFGACGGASGVGADGAGGGPAAALQGLCDAESAAAAGDVRAARTAFADRAHATLHQVAADLQDRNPSFAGQLLEAKQSVEAALAEGAPAEVLASRLAGLRAAFQASLAVARTPVKGCR
jgi:hypothetical protein